MKGSAIAKGVCKINDVSEACSVPACRHLTGKAQGCSTAIINCVHMTVYVNNVPDFKTKLISIPLKM
jgi:hypothetical protein